MKKKNQKIKFLMRENSLYDPMSFPLGFEVEKLSDEYSKLALVQ